MKKDKHHEHTNRIDGSQIANRCKNVFNVIFHQQNADLNLKYNGTYMQHMYVPMHVLSTRNMAKNKN